MSYEEQYHPLISYLEPLQKEIKIDLTDVRNLRDDRNLLAHYKLIP